MSETLKDAVELSRDYTSGLIRADFSSPLHCRKGFMVVEGNDDVLFYRKYIIPNTKIYPAFKSKTQGGGNNHVIYVVEVVNQWAIGVKICGIIDADYRRFTDDVPAGNVFFTDHRDIEMTVMAAGSVQPVLSRMVSLQQVMPVAKFLGIMRLCNAKYDLGIKFKKIVKKSIIFDGASTLICDWRKAVESEFWHNLPFKDKWHKIVYIVSTWIMLRMSDGKYQDSDICCGHDLLKLLAFAENNSKSDKDIWEEISNVYTVTDFEGTKLYHRIANWYRENALL